MCNWNYIRYCPYCKKDKQYPTKGARNGKARCPECLDKYYLERRKTIICYYCKGINKFKTNIIKEYIKHIIDDCKGFPK